MPSRLAAANRWVARRMAALCSPGMRRQLPFVPGFLPSTGSNPGQQCWFFFVPVTFLLPNDFFALIFLPADLLEEIFTADVPAEVFFVDAFFADLFFDAVITR